VQDPERGRVDVNSNEILAANLRIPQLVDIWNICTCYFARLTFPTTLVTQSLAFLVSEKAFPKDAFLNFDDTVGAIVIMYWCLMPRSPTKHQHFNGLVLTNAMPPIIAFFEAEIRSQIFAGNYRAFQPGSNLLERWWGRLGLKCLHQVGKRYGRMIDMSGTICVGF